MKFTKELGKTLCAMVSEGTPLGTAAMYNRVSPGTVNSWVVKGQDDPTSIYGEFSVDYLQAKAAYLAAIKANIDRASKRDWKAGAWILERADRENYGVAKEPTVVQNLSVTALQPDTAASIRADVLGLPKPVAALPSPSSSASEASLVASSVASSDAEDSSASEDSPLSVFECQEILPENE